MSMPRFLFEYVQMFFVIGDGTPENPGGDFTMHCWIDATDANAALRWGHVLLGDYYRARFAHAVGEQGHDGSPIAEGEIVSNPEILARAHEWNIPSCALGEIPTWREPWRLNNTR